MTEDPEKSRHLDLGGNKVRSFNVESCEWEFEAPK